MSRRRDGKPAVVAQDGKQTEMIRLNFPGFSGNDLKEISWDKGFKLFEENNLERLY